MSLDVRGLTFAYDGGEPVLAGVDFDVGASESSFLLGPSGSGKSTILRCVAGLERGYGGRVIVDGESIDHLPPHKRRVGMLFQEPALFPHLDVRRNVQFGMRYAGVPRRDERPRAEALLAMVGLPHKADARVDALSGGERQRVALARALAAKPRVVLLDEPLSALDRDLREDLGMRLKKLLADEGVAALWVTHDHDEAHRLADRAWTMDDGRVRRMEREEE